MSVLSTDVLYRMKVAKDFTNLLEDAEDIVNLLEDAEWIVGGVVATLEDGALILNEELLSL
ncbi:hypothetical protein IC620_15160 [Hazenella sp. IB182357]|uniref:Uncharacterized protein n=1 Tax=Polycladospora coralii TaxID=2771432 RepID=A0A926N6Y5_9BACL|nr:hypothetical protein [Polycladospora coralii]MBD1373684.1 hypothetical protein [Polycladospora coralii]